MWTTDVVVAGAGAVGLACAAALAKRGLEVIVLERAGAIGTETSSRSSEVIHGGMYYPTGSLKQRMCVEGRRKLYAYMDAHGVAYRRYGKLIVATEAAEIPQIEAIHRRGRDNGVEDLTLLSGAEARAMEPALACEAALWSPQTGIMDSHGLMLALQGEIEDHGGAIAFKTPVTAVTSLPGGGFRVRVGGESEMELDTRCFVNSAGLHATKLAERIDGYAPDYLPTFALAKGCYFSCTVKPVFGRLIYPAPVEGGLGVHVTLDLAGRMRFGPDVEWLDFNDPEEIDYAVDPRRAEGFYAAVRRYWPTLPDGSIRADYSGCRPKLSRKGEPAADFRIDDPATHGLEGLVNLFGIESPGLTSSLAIADEVAELLD